MSRKAGSPGTARGQVPHSDKIAAPPALRRAAGVTACRRYGNTSPRPAGEEPARTAALTGAAGLFT